MRWAAVERYAERAASSTNRALLHLARTDVHRTDLDGIELCKPCVDELRAMTLAEDAASHQS